MSNKLIGMKILFYMIIFVISVILIVSCRSRNKFAINDSEKTQIQITDTILKSEGLLINIDSVYIIPDIQAGFHGGDYARVNFFEENLKFPVNINDSIKQVIILLSFIVERDSSASRIRVIKGNDESFIQEAIRLIKLAKWDPGKINGQNVRSAFAIPVIFKR